ncbi:hypothetical protein [Achromobacter kerstersii]
MATDKPAYDTLDELAKINKQWVKLSGLHNREEWSAAVVRAATAAELAATFAIRKEFATQSKLPKEFVDEMLMWANGIRGKFENLLLNLVAADEDKTKKFRALWATAKTINKKRNLIAHGGQFCDAKEATEIIATCKEVVLGVVGVYDPAFKLKEKKASK